MKKFCQVSMYPLFLFVCCFFSEFKSKLKEANVDAESKLMKGALHGFFSFPGVCAFAFFVFSISK